MTDKVEIELLQEHLYAIEEFLERIAPVLIGTSPARQEIETLLRTWAGKETSDPEEVRLGDLADTILTAIPPAGGT